MNSPRRVIAVVDLRTPILSPFHPLPKKKKNGYRNIFFRQEVRL